MSHPVEMNGVTGEYWSGYILKFTDLVDEGHLSVKTRFDTPLLPDKIPPRAELISVHKDDVGLRIVAKDLEYSKGPVGGPMSWHYEVDKSQIITEYEIDKKDGIKRLMIVKYPLKRVWTEVEHGAVSGPAVVVL